MNKNAIIQILLGILITIALGISGWSLQQHYNTNAKLTELDVVLKRLEKATEWKVSKDKTDSMHWKYLSWSRHHITDLYHVQNLPLPPSPDLTLD